MHLTPKARRILGFVEGFELMHRSDPCFEDILAYTLGPAFRNVKPKTGDVASRLGITLGRLCDHGYILRTGKRYRTVKPQRTLVLAFNRASGTLEPHDVNAPIRDLVTGKV
jgi:hypothetical protein